jgi:hypothetical protein
VFPAPTAETCAVQRERCRDDGDTGRRGVDEEQAGADPKPRAAEELVRRAREQGLLLTGPDGLLKQLTKVVLETATARRQLMTVIVGGRPDGDSRA